MRVTVCTIHPKTFATQLTTVEVPDGAKVSDALAAAGVKNIEARDVAVFARKASLDTPLTEGDRIDVACDLLIDPKRARELRAQNKSVTAIPRPRHGGKHQLIKPLDV